MSNLKSQVSIEFMVAFGALMISFIIILGFVVNKRLDLEETKEEIKKINSCYTLSALITSAQINQDTIFIDTKLDFNVTINGTTQKEMLIDPIRCLPTIQSINNVQLKKGDIRIQASDNEVIITNV
jgi:hypothetical protein